MFGLYVTPSRLPGSSLWANRSGPATTSPGSPGSFGVASSSSNSRKPEVVGTCSPTVMGPIDESVRAQN